MGNLQSKFNGEWTPTKALYVNQAGVWKAAKKAFIRKNSVWVEIYSDIITDGLILHLDSTNNLSYPGSGTIWYDLSSRGNNVVMDSVYTPTFNNTDKSFYFTGGDNFETKNANELLTSNLTMIGWYKKTGNGNGSPRILEMIQSGVSSGANSHCLAIDTDGSYRAWVDVDGITTNRIASASDATTYNLNEWYMYAYTFDGTIGRIYHNGVETATRTGTSSKLDTINTITIGAIPDVNYSHSNHCFTGNLAITQIYNKTLTLSEIQQNFEATRGKFGI